MLIFKDVLEILYLTIALSYKWYYIVLYGSEDKYCITVFVGVEETTLIGFLLLKKNTKTESPREICGGEIHSCTSNITYIT
jgi:hypothetical protein